MKRNFKFFTLILLVIGILFWKSITPFVVYALEDLGKEPFEVRGLEEANKIYGSILHDEFNYAHIKIPPNFYRELLRENFENISVKFSGSGFGPYDVPVLRKKSSFGKSLIVDLSKIKDSSGKIISPASIPFGIYNLHIFVIKGVFQGTQTASKEFTYFPPAVTAFQAIESSVVFVENLDGKIISDSFVAAKPVEKQIIEVRSNKFQVPFNEKTIVVLHAVSVNKNNLLALVDIQASPDSNFNGTLIPVIINEKNSFLAHLVRSTQGSEKVKDFLKNNPNGLRIDISSIPLNDIDCDIKQFIDFCSPETFSEIGEGFKDFLETAICSDANLNLYKEIVKDMDNLSLGRHYCEYFRSEFPQQDICNFYLEVLEKFKAKKLPKLPCPPEICDGFKNIKPPKCGDFVICNEGDIDPISEECIIEPKKDLFCTVIENQSQEDECKNDPRGFTTITSSDGTKYCVPTGSPEKIIEECKLIECHKKCEIPSPEPTPKPTPTPGDPPFVFPISDPVSNPPTQPITEPPFVFPTRGFDTDSSLQTSKEPVKSEEPIKPINKECHLKCDADFGRKVDCTNPNSEFFSIKCCDPKIQESIIIIDPKADKSFRIATSDLPSLKNCLCKDPNNFNEKGFIKKETISSCQNICPDGFILNEFGKCVCPECREPDKECPKGKILDPVTGKCVKEIKCESGQFLDAFGVCRCILDGSIPGPEGCKKKEEIPGENICPARAGPSITIPCKCAPPAVAVGNDCVCSGNKIYAGEKGCIDKAKEGELAICPAGTGPSITIPCKCKSPAKAVGNECVCPQGEFAVYAGEKGCIEKKKDDGELPICPAGTGPSITIPCKCKEPAKAVGNDCVCPQGEFAVYAGEKGCIEKTTPDIPICTPTQFKSAIIPCKCASGAEFNDEGLCRCLNGKPYTKDGCGDATIPPPTPTPTSTASPKPSSTPVPTPTFSPSPTPKGTICQKNEKTTTSGCVCATGATEASDKTCQCKSGENYTINGCTTAICSVNQASTALDPCACKGTATPTGAGGICVCPNGKDYSPTLGGCPD